MNLTYQSTWICAIKSSHANLLTFHIILIDYILVQQTTKYMTFLECVVVVQMNKQSYKFCDLILARGNLDG
jgi:hypothetical protein